MDKSDTPISLKGYHERLKDYTWKAKRHVHGILGVHVDDLLGGGDEYWRKSVNELKKRLEFGA
eukprot:2736679-Alexandrium_andersonii.AAC.1